MKGARPSCGSGSAWCAFCAASTDAIRLHAPGATGGLAVAVVTRTVCRDAAFVVTEHDVPNEKWDRWDLLTRSTMDRFADVVIAVSRRNAHLRSERLRAQPRHYAAILNGVPLATSTPAERARNRHQVRAQLDLRDDAVVLGSLVRLDEGKGLRNLLPAFADVVREYPCELLLVGDGPLRAELEALAVALGITSRVHFAGHQAQPGPFLDAMDGFVLAVPAGSMSIALLEAMSHGLPAAITFCGPEEAIIPDETGLCAPPNDPAGLGQVLLRLARTPTLRATLGPAGEQHVRRHFSVAASPTTCSSSI